MRPRNHTLRLLGVIFSYAIAFFAEASPTPNLNLAANSLNDSTLTWSFADPPADRTLLACKSFRIIIGPEGFVVTPPYYIIGFDTWEGVRTSYIGDTWDDLVWIVDYPVGSRSILNFMDSTGRLGNASVHPYTVIDNVDCPVPTEEDLEGFLFDTVLYVLIFGIYVTLSFQACFLVLSRGFQRSKARLVLFSIVALMLMLSSAMLIITIESFYDRLKPLKGLSVRVLHANKLRVVSDVLARTNFVLGDGVVVWRAWILFPSSKTVKGLLTICILGSIACSVADITFRVVLGTDNAGTFYSAPQIGHMLLVLPLLLTNVVSTVLIAYREWRYRQEVVKYLTIASGLNTKIKKILLLLIESGLVYCCFWIIYICLGVFTNSSDPSYVRYTAIMPYLAAIYPTLLILMLGPNEAADEATNETMSLSQSLRFMQSQTETIASHMDLSSYRDNRTIHLSSIATENRPSTLLHRIETGSQRNLSR
ncbi:hypothetical protein VKT23_015863 [Stygiomarasmius scandens]|uniref:Uncharacterized protein n=1 Tax=Marasmiellus scandens TaxID=2682957 RepID=A0ABR1IX03_9AGAR